MPSFFRLSIGPSEGKWRSIQPRKSLFICLYDKNTVFFSPKYWSYPIYFHVYFVFKCFDKIGKKEETKMKKLFLISLILGLFVSYGYSQTAGQKSETGKGMMGGQKGQMMDNMDNMKGMMDQMSGMMTGMPEMMKQMSPEKRKTMSEMMKGMSQQMMDMSKMMDKGTASDKDMKMMQDKMMQMQKKMSEIEMKK